MEFHVGLGGDTRPKVKKSVMYEAREENHIQGIFGLACELGRLWEALLGELYQAHNSYSFSSGDCCRIW